MSGRTTATDEPSLVRYTSRVLVHFVLAMENRQGIMAEVASTVTTVKGNILWGTHSVEVGASAGVWSFYVDLTESSASADELKRKLAGVRGVADVSVKEGENGILVRHPRFPFYTQRNERNEVDLESRSITMTVSWLQNLVAAMKERFGSGGNAIVFYFGLDGGKAAIRKFMDSGLRDMAAIEACLQLDQSLGWGVFSVSHLDLDKKAFTVSVMEAAECSGKISEKPNMVLMRGYLVGVFSEAFGKEFHAEEVKCIARGDKQCELLLGPK